jgi:hypothetical protein
MRRETSAESFHVDGKLQLYDEHIYRTDGGQLLIFIGDSDKWKAPYPGKTWDNLYDTDLYNIGLFRPQFKILPYQVIGPAYEWCRTAFIKNSNKFNDLILHENFNAASKLVIFPKCENIINNYKHCSMKCWYLDLAQSIMHSIEQSQHIISKRPYKEIIDILNRQQSSLQQLHIVYHNKISW